MKKLLSILGLSVVIVLAGAAMFASASQNNVTEESVPGVQNQATNLEVVRSNQEAKSAADQNHSKGKLTIEEAIAIARQHAEGTVKEVELDEDDGRLYYEIEMRDGKYEYELDIDAYTGDVLDFEKDLDD